MCVHLSFLADFLDRNCLVTIERGESFLSGRFSGGVKTLGVVLENRVLVRRPLLAGVFIPSVGAAATGSSVAAAVPTLLTFSPRGESGSVLTVTGLVLRERREPRLGARRLRLILPWLVLDLASEPGSTFSIVSSKDTCVAATCDFLAEEEDVLLIEELLSFCRVVLLARPRRPLPVDLLAPPPPTTAPFWGVVPIREQSVTAVAVPAKWNSNMELEHCVKQYLLSVTIEPSHQNALIKTHLHWTSLLSIPV